jgi:hypothetical protein
MTPIHVVCSRMKRLPLHHQIAHLRALVDKEKPRSVRRVELEALLKERVTKQLRKENRAA